MFCLNNSKFDKTNAYNDKKRISWIDAVRVFAIFCIVLGHVINGNNIVWHVVYGFHVPLFIILGGFTFSCKSKDFFGFAKKKFLSIMVPYYFWGSISICIYFLISRIIGEDSLNIFQCVVGLIIGTAKNGYMRWNTPMWYLPMYFCTQILSFILFKNTPNNRIRCLYGTISFALAYVLYLTIPNLRLPFGLSSLIFLYPFFIFGSILGTVLNKIDKLGKIKKLFFSFLLVIISMYIIMRQNNIDYVTDVYRNYPIFVFSAIAASLGIIIIIREISKYNRLISLVGSNTLGIMILQKFPVFFFVHICPGIRTLYHTNTLIVSIAVTLITIVSCTAFCVVGVCYAPWAFGRVFLAEKHQAKGRRKAT